MKKGMILIAVFMGSVLGTKVNAQTSFGLKLNAGITDLKLSGMPGKSHTFKPAASLGGFARIGLSEHFALQPELVFNYTESQIKHEGEKTKFKYAGVEIPVYGVGQIKLGNGILTAGIGPHIGYGFSADSKVENLPEDSPLNNVIEMDHWYAGGGVTVGYEFPIRISVNGTYQLSYDIRSGKNISQVNTQTISLGICYRF